MSRLRDQAALAGAFVLLAGLSPQHGTSIGVRAESDTPGVFSISSGGPIETLTRPTFIRSVSGRSASGISVCVGRSCSLSIACLYRAVLGG